MIIQNSIKVLFLPRIKYSHIFSDIQMYLWQFVSHKKIECSPNTIPNHQKDSH